MLRLPPMLASALIALTAMVASSEIGSAQSSRPHDLPSAWPSEFAEPRQRYEPIALAMLQPGDAEEAEGDSDAQTDDAAISDEG
jgi:hypothetical protein